MCTEGMVHGDSQLGEGKSLQTLRARDCSAGPLAPVCPARRGMRQNVPAKFRLLHGDGGTKNQQHTSFRDRRCARTFRNNCGESRNCPWLLGCRHVCQSD